MAISKVKDAFMAKAKELGAPQWLAQQGMELSNLIESGFLQPQSIANKAQITKAKNMYTEALGNKSFRNAQAAKLKSSGTVKTVQPIERPIITPESLQGSIITPLTELTAGYGGATGVRLKTWLGLGLRHRVNSLVIPIDGYAPIQTTLGCLMISKMRSSVILVILVTARRGLSWTT